MMICGNVNSLSLAFCHQSSVSWQFNNTVSKIFIDKEKKNTENMNDSMLIHVFLPKMVNDFFCARALTWCAVTHINTTKMNTGLTLLVSTISRFFLSSLIAIIMAVRCLGFIQSYSHLCQYLSVCLKIVMQLFLVSPTKVVFFFHFSFSVLPHVWLNISHSIPNLFSPSRSANKNPNNPQSSSRTIGYMTNRAVQ